MTEPIRIRRDELFTKGVDEALARERRLRGGAPVATEPVSPLRALLLSPLFYLPAAATLAALLVWLFIEPRFDDFWHAGGEVRLVNRDPFDYVGTMLTVGDIEVVLDEDVVVMEPGANGEPAFASISAIEPGATIEVTGDEWPGGGNRLMALAIRPTSPERAAAIGTAAPSMWWQATLFPLTSVLIAIALLVAEGIASRNWVRMIERTLPGAGLTLVFSVLSYFPAGMCILVGSFVFEASLTEAEGYVTAETMKPVPFLVYTACRAAAWACFGAALGVGMNLVRATKAQLRNAVVGGALGGALGGMFFDPIDRFTRAASWFEADAAVSRVVGLLAVGACVGLFVALVEQLAREAWVRVRTGPLAGKSFVLYRTPTTLGSAPNADIYLFKDAEIAPRHAAIHRLGNRYEIEDLGSRAGVEVAGTSVRRRRLNSGDQIVLGATVLEFEERAKKTT